MDHIFHVCKRDTCAICNGGLQLCIVCGQAESELEKTCPGKLPDLSRDLNIAREQLETEKAILADIIGRYGAWINLSGQQELDYSWLIIQVQSRLKSEEEILSGIDGDSGN